MRVIGWASVAVIAHIKVLTHRVNQVLKPLMASLAASFASIAEPLASLAASVALSAAFIESVAPGAGDGAGVTTTGGGGLLGVVELELGVEGGGVTTVVGLSHAASIATTATAAKIDLFIVIPLLVVRSARCFRIGWAPVTNHGCARK